MRTIIEWLISFLIVIIVLAAICHALDVAEKHHIEELDRMDIQSRKDKLESEKALAKEKIELQQKYFDKLLFNR